MFTGQYLWVGGQGTDRPPGGGGGGEAGRAWSSGSSDMAVGHSIEHTVGPTDADFPCRVPRLNVVIYLIKQRFFASISCFWCVS